MDATKPSVINRGQNHVIVSWRDVAEVRGEVRVLEVVDELKKWAAVYRGRKDEVRVGGLAPCTCYDFRVRGDEGEWVGFKGATSEGPYLAMHMGRAVKAGKTALVRKIAHARPLLLEVENKEMKTPLVQAIEKNDLPLVNLLITLGANVNTVSHYSKRSPLMTAVTLGHLSVANLLVEKGCNVGATDVNGLNILHCAVDSNIIDSVRFAIKHTSCVDTKDCNGWTPLLRAAILNCSDDIINVLLENGASKLVKDRNGFDFDKHRYLASKLLSRGLLVDTSVIHLSNFGAIIEASPHSKFLVFLAQMLSNSSSSISNITNISDDSVLSQRPSRLQILGLPDIFSPSSVVTRPFLANKKQENCEELRIQIDGKDYICRICHGGDSSGDLLAVCRCKGSIALTHLKCLEIWLNESNRNECEICQYHFRVIREPKYGVTWSIFMFLRHPGEHLRELLIDGVTLIVYTPSTVSSTYMLMLLCETLNKADPEFRRTLASHVMAFSAIFAINFIYTSWLVLLIEKYVDYWRDWYKKNCSIRVILSDDKLDSPSPSSNEPP